MARFLVLPCLLLPCHESSSRIAFQAHTNSCMSYTPLNLHPRPYCLHELTFAPPLKPMGMKPCHWLPLRRKNGQVWQRSESDDSLSSLKSRFFVYFPRLWKLFVAELLRKESNAMWHFLLKRENLAPHVLHLCMFIHLLKRTWRLLIFMSQWFLVTDDGIRRNNVPNSLTLHSSGV